MVFSKELESYFPVLQASNQLFFENCLPN